ncbi:MAG: diaminopimelate decarboxylase [Pyrinomonas sp.]|uniref:diaminopimelate decarboxylase n=1 Tax=Pyrinomonas sp. TaxID=2080306 RepID=UPI003320099E
MSQQNVASLPAWTIAGHIEPQRGHLAINGVDAIELAKQHDTPLFVFSEPRISENIARLKRAAQRASRPIRFCYASKANSLMAVLGVVRDAGIDIEVNSGGELYKALRAGFRPDQIVFNGTSKTESEINQAVEAGIYAINVDSIYEIELVLKSARMLGSRARIALRLVPEVETRSHPGLQTALLTSKFGISAAEVDTAFSRALAHPELVHLCGLHIHVGSQTPDVEPFARAFEVIWRHLVAVHHATGHMIEHINLGGGFPVNYLRDRAQAEALPAHEREMFAADLDPADVVDEVLRVARREAEKAQAEHLFDRLTLLFEPGRSIVADAGVLLTAVRNIKRRPETGDTWLLTDAGFNLLLSMSTYHWYYQLISAARADAPHDAPYKVAGPLCDSGDVYFDIERQGRLPDYRLLPRDVRPGELLALLNAGAYTVAQMFPYNGRPLPAVVMVRGDGRSELIRRRDSYEDLLMNEVWC